MTRRNTILAALAAAAVLGATAVHAQSQAEQTPQAERAPMHDEAMPGGLMQQGTMPMMGMMGMMGEMQEMMRTCNQMMKAMMPDETRPMPQDRPDRG